MAVPSGFCQAEITANCLVRNTTLQIFIGVTPITNPFTVLTTDTQITLQSKITIATIGIGVTITIQNDSVFPLTCSGGNSGFLHLLVQVASTTQITDLLIVTDSDEGYNTINVTTFTCNLAPSPIPKKKNRRRNVGAFYNGNTCFNRYDNLGREINCPQQIVSKGIIYTKISSDPYTCCYQKSNTNDIYNR